MAGGEALLSAGTAPGDLIRLDDLALPYSKAICRHLQSAPKQITTSAGKFLNACSSWNDGMVDDEALRDVTMRLGFNNVIDAFHNIGGDLGVRFFIDERRESKGIRLTDEFRRLAADRQAGDLVLEVEARWRLAQRLLREAGFIKVEVTGKSGDGGIDGIGVLRVNLLSFQVLFQCKRYQGSVGASGIRDFRGAMVGRSDKGLMITTGTFTSDAKKEATRDGAPAIDLIDGD